jgi:hypothetical protein
VETAWVNYSPHGTFTELISDNAEAAVRQYRAKRPVERPSGLSQPALQHPNKETTTTSSLPFHHSLPPSAEKHSKCQIGERSGLNMVLLRPGLNSRLKKLQAFFKDLDLLKKDTCNSLRPATVAAAGIAALSVGSPIALLPQGQRS